MKKICQRIYSDFFLPSRLGEYRNLLIKASGNGYKIISIEQFYRFFIINKDKGNQKYLVLRHDIDSNTPVTKMMFQIEKELDVYASYYFRLSTVDVLFMKEIHNYGSEASYHYEEIATYAKQHKIREPNKIYSNMTEIRKMFSNNLKTLRDLTNIPMEIVASHGDFVNRYLKITNNEILKDPEFRIKNNIKLEVYDYDIMQYVTSRHSDCGYPTFWKPYSPEMAIENGSKVVYVLTHPGHWRANTKENIKTNYNRLKEGIMYKF